MRPQTSTSEKHKAILEPTLLPCPSAPDGGTHHLEPHAIAGGQVMVCRYCESFEEELR